MTEIPSNNAVREVIDAMHQCIVRKVRGGSSDPRVVEDNRLFRLICENSSRDPGEYARDLVEKYAYDVRGGAILNTFRYYGISSPEKREKLCSWAGKVVDQFALCLKTKKRSDLEKLKELRGAAPKSFTREGKSLRFYDRVLSIMLYMLCPELNIHNDIEKLEQFGNIWSGYFLDEVLDILDSFCLEESDDTDSESDALKLAYEQEKRKVAQLSAALERANTAMQDLEAEFEERLEEGKTDNLTEFFARLNSEKYGCILDELLSVRKGVGELMRQDFDLPIEVSGLFMVIIKLTKFIRDSHIDPIMKVNSIRTITAEDVTNCDYEGTPFKDKDDRKTVRVISPGWIYVDKEIQIARPKLMEVIENEA